MWKFYLVGKKGFLKSVLNQRIDHTTPLPSGIAWVFDWVSPPPTLPFGISNSLRGGGMDIFWNHTMWITLNVQSRLQNCWNKSSLSKDTSSTVANSSTCSAMESSRNRSTTCFFYLAYQIVNYTVVKLMYNTEPFFPFLCQALFLLGYLRYYTALSEFVQFDEDCVQLLECSPASCLAPRNLCEEKCEKFITHRSNINLPSHFGFDTCRHSVEFWKAGESIFFIFRWMKNSFSWENIFAWKKHYSKSSSRNSESIFLTYLSISF